MSPYQFVSSVQFSSLYVYDGTVQTAQPFGLDSNPRDRGTEVPTLQRAAPTTRGSCNVLYTKSDTRAPGAQAKHWSQRARVTSYPLAGRAQLTTTPLPGPNTDLRGKA